MPEKIPDWDKLPAEEIALIVDAYDIGNIAAMEMMASKHGIAAGSLGRYARAFKQYMKPQYLQAYGILQDRKLSGPTMIKLPVESIAPRLTDITEVDPNTDAFEWLDWLHSHRQADITAMHPCDIHIPFHDPRALSLFFQILSATQPNVVTVGSDFGDFYNLSLFGTNPDELREDGSDVLGVFESHWVAFINEIKRLSPKSTLIYMNGNHEMRYYRFLTQQAPQFRKRLLADYRTILRQGGNVMYIGNVDHVRMGPLRMEHGVRHNEHVSKSRVIDMGGQVSHWMGHVHKRNFYEMRGEDFAVSGISSGGLCQRDPHYMREGSSTCSGRKWVQGTAVGTFNLSEHDVEFENVGFHDAGYALSCFFRGNRLSGEPSDPSVLPKV